MLCLSLDTLLVLFQTLYADSVQDASTAMIGRMHSVSKGILLPRYLSSAKLRQLHSSVTSAGTSVHFLFAKSQLRVLTCELQYRCLLQHTIPSTVTLIMLAHLCIPCLRSLNCVFSLADYRTDACCVILYQVLVHVKVKHVHTTCSP
jgi:hypothetical protein